MVVFLLLLCLWFYLSFFKFRLAKKLEKQAKNSYFNIQPTLNINLTTIMSSSLMFWSLVVLNIFVGERSLEPPTQLAATDLNRQVEEVLTVLKYTFGTQRNSFSVTDFLISYLLLHAYRLVRQLQAWKLGWNYQKRCRILKRAPIFPSHFSRHLQGHFLFRKLCLECTFGSSKIKLKLLVILVIILLFGFGHQGPLGLV